MGPTKDKLLEIMLKMADKDPEMLPMLVQNSERLHIMMIIMAVAHLIEDGQQEAARGYLQACNEEFTIMLDNNLKLNLAMNKLSFEESFNEKVAAAIIAQMEKDT